MTENNKAAEPHPRATWPYLARERPAAVANPAFDDAELMKAYRPGREVCVYAFGCRGLHDLNAGSILKVGCTSTDLRYRLAQVGRDRYGAATASGDSYAIADGFELWMAQPLHVEMALSPNSPVRPAVRGLRVTLPADLTILEFDEMLADRLNCVAVNHVVSSETCRRRCAAIGIDPARLQRFTAYDFGGSTRYSRAREIVFFRPRLDSDHLVVIIEAIIVEHLTRQGYRLTA